MSRGNIPGIRHSSPHVPHIYHILILKHKGKVLKIFRDYCYVHAINIRFNVSAGQLRLGILVQRGQSKHRRAGRKQPHPVGRGPGIPASSSRHKTSNLAEHHDPASLCLPFKGLSPLSLLHDILFFIQSCLEDGHVTER